MGFRRRALGAMALAATAACAAQVSGASFTDAKSNPGNSLAAAADFCVGAGTQSLAAAQDAYVNAGQPNTNAGSGSTLFVESVLLNLPILVGNRRALVQFSLPAIPSHCDVTAATLKLYATSSSSGRTIDVYRLAGPWTEGGVTWNNQPSTTGSAASAASGTGTRSWDVTSQVQAMYSGANNGFLVRDSSEGSLTSRVQAYQSREGSPDSQDPVLEVTFG